MPSPQEKKVAEFRAILGIDPQPTEEPPEESSVGPGVNNKVEEFRMILQGESPLGVSPKEPEPIQEELPKPVEIAPKPVEELPLPQDLVPPLEDDWKPVERPAMPSGIELTPGGISVHLPMPHIEPAIRIAPDLKQEFADQQEPVFSETVAPVVVEAKAPAKLLKYNQNPSVNLALNALRKLEEDFQDRTDFRGSEEKSRAETTLYDAIGRYVLRESMLPNRPLDQEIAESKALNVEGFTKAVDSDYKKPLHPLETMGANTRGSLPFGKTIEGSLEFSEEEYQQYVLQKIAQENGLDFALLNKSLLSARKFAEESALVDFTMDERYIDKEEQVKLFMVDLLNMGLGFATLAIGGADAGLVTQQTGPAGELLDVRSQAAMNMMDLQEFGEFYKKGKDIFSTDMVREFVESKNTPLSYISNLSKISARSGRNVVEETDVFIPQVFPTDIARIARDSSAWKEKARARIILNLERSPTNRLIDVPAIPLSPWEQTAGLTNEDKANAVLELLEGAMFTSNPEEALGKLAPLIADVELPVNSKDTLGNRVSIVSNEAIGWLDQNTSAVPDARMGPGGAFRVPNMQAMRASSEESFNKVFVDAKGMPIPISQVELYSEEKINNFISNYALKEFAEDAVGLVEKGYLGEAYYKKGDSPDLKEIKKGVGAAIMVSSYVETMPQFNTTSQEYASHLMDGIKGIPEDMLLSFIAVDIAMRDITVEDNIYTASQIAAAKEKLEQDFAYVVMDLASVGSLVGQLGKAGIILGRAVPKVPGAIRSKMMAPKQKGAKTASGMPESQLVGSNVLATIDYLMEFANETKTQIRVQQDRIAKASIKPVTTEEVKAITSNDPKTTSVTHTGEKSIIDLDNRVATLEKELSLAKNKPDANDADTARMETQIEIARAEAEVAKLYESNLFEKQSSRPTRQDAGFDEFEYQKDVQTYKEYTNSYPKERDAVKNYNDLLKAATKEERAHAENLSRIAFDRIMKNYSLDGNWTSVSNSNWVVNVLQANGVVDPGVWRYFLKHTKDPGLKASNELAAILITETKTGLAQAGKKLAHETFKKTASKEELAKMSNQPLAEFITREQSIKVADDLAKNGVTNPFAYARLPFITDEQIRHFIKRAEAKKVDPKLEKTIISTSDPLIDDNLTVTGKVSPVDPKTAPPRGLFRSRFKNFFGTVPKGTKGFSLDFGVAGDTAKRWLFGDRAVNLAANKEYAYAFAESMSSPLAFVNIPKAYQNFLSETHLWLDSAGKSNGFLYNFLDNFITPENRLGSSLYYDLISIAAKKDVNSLEMQQLISKIPRAGEFVVDRRVAAELFDMVKDDLPDFADINALEFDNLVQAVMSKDSPFIHINGEKIAVDGLMELRVNQRGKLETDIAKLNRRLEHPSLREGSEIYNKLLARRNAIQKKLDTGGDELYISVDELYGSLADKRQQLADLTLQIKTNPANKASLLVQRDMLISDIQDLASISSKEAVSGVTDLKWFSKKDFSDMTATERTVFFAAQDVVTPIQQRIYNTIAQIMVADDTVILAQKNSNAPRNIVVRNTDKGYVPVKVFDDSSVGADNAFDYASELNDRTKHLSDTRLKGYIAEGVDDIPEQAAVEDIAVKREGERYEVVNADEIVSKQGTEGLPILKRAMDVPATDLVPMMSRYLSIYVDSSSLLKAATEMWNHSLTLPPGERQQLINSYSRRMLYAFDNGTDLIAEHGSPSKALQAILDMKGKQQKKVLGRALLPQERFYAAQAFGNVMTPAELLSVKVNARFGIWQTFVGLAENMQQYRVLNASFNEGGLLTTSQWGKLSPREKARFVPLENVHGRSPGWGVFEDMAQSLFKKLDDSDKKKLEAVTVGDASTSPLFGEKKGLFIAKSHAAHFSDMAGLIDLSTKWYSKTLSYYKKAKILSFTSGIMPIQMFSSVFYHGAMLSKKPGALFNFWAFKNGPSILKDVIRVKMGKQPKNPLVREAAEHGTITTGQALDLSPSTINESLFLTEALAVSGDFAKNPTKGLDNLVAKLHDLHVNAPNAAVSFVDDMKVSFTREGAKPVVGSGNRLTLRSAPGVAADATVAGVKAASAATTFSYSLFDDFLKTLYAVSMKRRSSMPMSTAAQEAIKVWFNYGDLSRNAQAMRYGVMSPFSSPFIGYTGNAAYAFPSMFADAPLRSAIAGHAGMVHNNAAIETVNIFNNLQAMRVAMGDPLALPFAHTAVERSLLSDRYGPGKEDPSDIVTAGPGVGTLTRIDPSPGGSYALSQAFRDPDQKNSVETASRGLFSGMVLDTGVALYELFSFATGDDEKSSAESLFEGEKESIETHIANIEANATKTPEQLKEMEDLTGYVDMVMRNDFKDPVYKVFKSFLPTQVTDIWEMLPATISVAKDRDFTNPRPYFGIKYGVADMNKVQKANVVSANAVAQLERKIETLANQNQSGNISIETIRENNKAIARLYEEMNQFENDTAKAKQLERDQIEAANRVKAALFSLYVAGESEIFIRERMKVIKNQK